MALQPMITGLCRCQSCSRHMIHCTLMCAPLSTVARAHTHACSVDFQVYNLFKSSEVIAQYVYLICNRAERTSNRNFHERCMFWNRIWRICVVYAFVLLGWVRWDLSIRCMCALKCPVNDLQQNLKIKRANSFVQTLTKRMGKYYEVENNI